jgi:hypothetical protein
MDVAYISALSALAGSVVGGLTSGMTTWVSNSAQARTARLANDRSRRQDLFRDFIVAASKLYGEALTSSEPPKIDELVGIYALISRMRVLCTARTVQRADHIMIATVEAFFAANKTVQELHELMKNGSGIDPLREFSEAAREELLSISPT